MSGKAEFRLKLVHWDFVLCIHSKFVSEWMNSLTLPLLFLRTPPLPQPSSFSCPSFSVSCLFKPSSGFLSLCHHRPLASIFPLQCVDWLEARQTIQLGNVFSSRLPLGESNKSNTLEAHNTLTCTHLWNGRKLSVLSATWGTFLLQHTCFLPFYSLITEAMSLWCRKPVS